jgi:hypothetical protein
MTDLALPGVAYAEVNWGIWLTRCPGRYCWNAMAVELGQALFVCLGPDSCGSEAPIVWPRDPQAIATLLRMRPDMRTQNWLPNETVQDLIVENAAHDCLPPEWTELTERTVISKEIDGVVVGGLLADALPPAAERLMIGSSGR